MNDKIACHWFMADTYENITTHQVASIRFRLGAALQSTKLEVSYGSKLPNNLKIVVWPKFTWRSEKDTIIATKIIKAAQIFRAKRVLQLVDYTDHHIELNIKENIFGSNALINQYSREAIENKYFYEKIIDLSNAVIVSSNAMQKKLYDIGVKKFIFVVPDAIDYYPNIIPNKTSRNRQAFWYGNHLSFIQLLENLIQFDGQLNEPLKLNCLTSLVVINSIKQGDLKIPRLRYVSLNFDSWALDKMIPYAADSDFIFIPSSNGDEKRRLVSSNRLITAFSLNRPILATPIPAYFDFSQFFIPYPSEQAKNYLINLTEYSPNLQEAKVLSSFYSFQNIGLIWEQAVEKIINLHN